MALDDDTTLVLIIGASVSLCLLLVLAYMCLKLDGLRTLYLKTYWQSIQQVRYGLNVLCPNQAWPGLCVHVQCVPGPYSYRLESDQWILNKSWCNMEYGQTKNAVETGSFQNIGK